jgi:hypothetical protein
MPESTSLVDRVILGASGREWTLPFDAVVHTGSTSPTFMGGLDRDVAAQTCAFLKRTTPKLFDEWRTAFINRHRLTENPNNNYYIKPVSACLADTTLLASVSLPTAEPAALRKAVAPPPTSVDVPEITPDHWYYKRHFNPGSYTAPTLHSESASLSEVRQDITSLHSYLTRYNELAHSTGGKELFEATTWAAFRAPYYSCMEMCIRDLQLPSHFLSMIHHGIGAHFAIGQEFIAWDQPTKSERHRELLDKTHEIFNTIAAMYREDFPRTQ